MIKMMAIGKGNSLLDMAIVVINVRFLGCMIWVGAILGALATG